jgi:hypothetical protein
MSEQASLVQEGVERFNAAFERIDEERLRIQKQVNTRRKRIEKQLTSGRKDFEKRTRKQVKRLRTELRRYPLVKRAEQLQVDARRQVEEGVDRFLGVFQIASKSDLVRIDRKLDRISRKLKDIEQPRRGNGSASSHA